MKLDMPAGNAARFEPGQTKRITLVQLGGKQFVHGFNNLVDGSVRTKYRKWQSYVKAQRLGFLTSKPFTQEVKREQEETAPKASSKQIEEAKEKQKRSKRNRNHSKVAVKAKGRRAKPHENQQETILGPLRSNRRR
jgi:hypothetical protein